MEIADYLMYLDMLVDQGKDSQILSYVIQSAMVAGSSYGSGSGNGYGSGSGYGRGNGSGYGSGDGDGIGIGYGDGGYYEIE